MRDVEIFMKGGARSCLDTVVGPQNLRSIGDHNGVIWGFVRMARGKRFMAGRMLVLGQHHVLKPPCQGVDDRNHFIAMSDRERPLRTKIFLNIDNQ